MSNKSNHSFLVALQLTDEELASLRIHLKTRSLEIKSGMDDVVCIEDRILMAVFKAATESDKLLVTSTPGRIEGITGYYARPTDKHGKAKKTNVHFVMNGKPVCGYRPHKTMRFQWCATTLIWKYLECKKCKEWVAKRGYGET